MAEKPQERWCMCSLHFVEKKKPTEENSVAGLRKTSREVEKIRQHEGVKAVSGDNQVLFQVYRKQSIAVFSRKASCSN